MLLSHRRRDVFSADDGSEGLMSHAAEYREECRQYGQAIGDVWIVDLRVWHPVHVVLGSEAEHDDRDHLQNGYKYNSHTCLSNDKVQLNPR